MKKRILSLAMAACLALSMMLTLSACCPKPFLPMEILPIWFAMLVKVLKQHSHHHSQWECS